MLAWLEKIDPVALTTAIAGLVTAVTALVAAIRGQKLAESAHKRLDQRDEDDRKNPVG